MGAWGVCFVVEDADGNGDAFGVWGVVGETDGVGDGFAAVFVSVAFVATNFFSYNFWKLVHSLPSRFMFVQTITATQQFKIRSK